ncbi:MAG: phosphoenolpyruvate carboxylase [Flavobacteriaceae bacterium]
MITKEDKIELFRSLISNRYLIYNSLFTNLPNEYIKHTSIFIPLLAKLSHQYYTEKKSPEQVINDFFEQYTDIKNKKEKFDFLFRVVQYVERQVVLFDSVEDAAFVEFNYTGIDTFLNSKPLSQETINHFKDFGVRVVFTAHPTQFYPNAVQNIMHQLRKAIKINDYQEVDKSLQQLAFTPFINREKPTPIDEAKTILFYLRYVYYQTLGRLYHKICEQLEEQPDFNPNLLQLGFWPGGDRDGNPFVNTETSLQVANELRISIIKCYYGHLKWLMKKITFHKTNRLLDDLKSKLYNAIFQDNRLISAQEILDTLNEVKAFLISDYNSLYVAEIKDFIGRVHLFGAHFASLDVRQDSSIHRELISEVVEKEFKLNWTDLTEDEKISLLTQRACKTNENHYEQAILSDTIKNIKQIKSIQQNNGPKSIHRYIISNTESTIDVLSVYGLFKFCGYDDDTIDIDIVPLFETMDGMANARAVMETLYTNPTYKKHLQRRNYEQHIMLGFSDGTKDGGYLKANWEIYKTKEVLTALSRAYNIKVIFFDGRGGPPARGGGKSYQFYASQGPEIENKNIQLTIQGQTITSVFGTHDQASYNFEQLLLSGVKSMQSNKMEPHLKETMTTLAEISHKKYLSLKNDPLFTSYMEDMTPLKQYGATNIGSRPTKRKQATKLELKDLRAIPFVGSWSMVRQNIPGYYGLGSALDAFKDNFEAIETLYEESDFFKTLIQNSIMSMKKTYFPLTSYMADHPDYGDFWKELRSEYLLAKKWALKLTNQTKLMENEPRSRKSISTRENIILPLLSIQQFALMQMQKNDQDYEIYEKLVIRCLFGNINASRNSA